MHYMSVLKLTVSSIITKYLGVISPRKICYLGKFVEYTNIYTHEEIWIGKSSTCLSENFTDFLEHFVHILFMK